MRKNKILIPLLVLSVPLTLSAQELIPQSKTEGYNFVITQAQSLGIKVVIEDKERNILTLCSVAYGCAISTLRELENQNVVTVEQQNKLECLIEREYSWGQPCEKAH